MSKLRLSLATAACAFSLNACNDATEPGPAVRPDFAAGGRFECTGPETGTFGNVVVPRDAFCTLSNSTVTGDIKALAGSILFIINTTVGGDIEGDKARNVELVAINGARNRVDGSIRIRDGGDGAFICGTDLPAGDIEVERMFGLDRQNGFVHLGGSICEGGFGGGNTLAQGSIRVKSNSTTIFGIGIEIVGNTVGGDLQVLRNTGPQTKLVQNNTVVGTLECFDNEPPFVGGPNTAGSVEGQCF
jgi:hypothetical protein